MTTALAKPQRLTPEIWKMIEAVAPTMHQSRLFGVSSPEQAAAIMLRGYELGLPLTASFEFIQMIQGKPSLSPKGALAIAQNSGELEEFKVEDFTDSQGTPTKCRVTGKRRGGMPYTIEITMDDARRAGLVKPGSGWESWPANMLRWRTVGFFLDVLMPDITGGMKRSDEYGAEITPAGDVIWQTPTPETQAQLTIADLIERYGVEKVVDANGGELPESDDQAEEILEKIGAQS